MSVDREQNDCTEDLYDDDLFERHQNDLMEMFDEASFAEKWRRVRAGLKMPVGSGPYKWARLQMLRLLSPVAAVVVPLIMLGLIVLFSSLRPDTDQSFSITITDPIPPEDVDDMPEEPVVDDLPLPEPIDIDVKITDVKQVPNDVVAPPRDMTVQQARIDSVLNIKSPVMLRGVYSSRSPGARAAALSKNGASRTENSVLMALRYLKKNQRSDGSWGNNRVAMTSLAVLAYLAHDDTPASPEFGSTVESALRYIVSQQQTDGHFRGHDNHDYTQPIAAYALAEAYAVTRNPNLKAPAVMAVNPIVIGQNPSGGFNYNLKPASRDDTSYMGWCVQALKSAKMAGLYADVSGLNECMHRSVNGFKANYSEGEYGRFRYTKTSGGYDLTGVGVLCLQFLGEANTRECRGALRNIASWSFDWEKPRGRSFLYYMYYTTQARFQAGGSVWKSWDAQFSPSLMANQRVIAKDASGYIDHTGQQQAIGNWKSPAPGEHNDGSGIMDTILCTLMLEVYYRYLPTFDVDKKDGDDSHGIGGEDDLDVDFVYNRDDCGAAGLPVVQAAELNNESLELCLN